MVREGVNKGEAVGSAGWVVAADEPLLSQMPHRFRYPNRKPLDDRRVLQRILFVLHTGIGREHLPQELGFACGMTAWRRLRAWQQAGVWEKLLKLVGEAARVAARRAARRGSTRMGAGDRRCDPEAPRRARASGRVGHEARERAKRFTWENAPKEVRQGLERVTS
jgi:transposase